MNTYPAAIAFEVDAYLGEPSGIVFESVPTESAPPVAPPTQAGQVAADSFSGTPLTYDVVFETPFSSDAYAICISGGDARIFTYQSQTENGFTINANSDLALTAPVSWITVLIGE
jgi:hypothetical protein